jgi:MarR family transcriptional regulator, organic hydroperoxide resistance regulator
VDDPQASDGLWLFELAPRLTRLENAVLQDVEPGLTFRQYRILRRVVEGETTITAIGKHATITLPAISESVDGLVRKGLLERHTDVRDRRAANLVLTEDGHRALDEAQQRLDVLAESILDGMSARRRQQLRRDVTHVRDRVTALLRDRR